MRSKKTDCVLIILFIFSLISRLAKLILDPVLMRDSTLYLEQAETWFSTGSYTEALIGGAIRPPIPLYTIKTMMHWGLESEVSGRVLSIFLGSLVPIIGFLLTKEITKKTKISLAVSLLLAVNPKLIEYSTQPLRDNYYMVAFGLSVLFFLKAAKNRSYYKWVVISGLTSSIAFLCRYEAVELFGVFILVMGIDLCCRRKNFARFMCSMIIFGISFLIPFIVFISAINTDYSFLSVKHLVKNYFTEESFE